MSRRKKLIKMGDLFCGGGGTSVGAINAINDLGFSSQLTALNHCPLAIETHKLNFPEHSERTKLADLDSVNPRHYFREGDCDLLWASPECTHHSKASGGRPKNDQSRSTVWCVTRWAEAVRPKVILVENVPEFKNWGPLGVNNQPLKSKKGTVFHAWIQTLEALGYHVGHRVLCAADYGDPTSRRRLFVQCVRGRRKIRWPEPTHGVSDMFVDRLPYRTARDIIDWSLPGTSIYNRKRPLAEKTLDRIWVGLWKYGLKGFLVPGQSERVGQSPRTHSVDFPLPTVTAQGHQHLVQPYLIQLDHQSSRNGVSGMGDLVSTVTTKARHCLVQPYLVKFANGGSAECIDDPLTTVRTSGKHHGLAQPYLIRMANNQFADSLDNPLSTLTTNIKHALIEPYLVKFYGTSDACSLNDPLGSVTTRERFGLVRPVLEFDGVKYILDILFRMLQPHELALAQGFPAGYLFAGTKTNAVKQIGNAVPCGLSRALVRAVLG